MKKLILFLFIVLIFSGSVVFSQSNTLYHDMYYFSHEQNMWGPDSAYGIDVDHTFFDIHIDESFGFTEITEFFGQQFGIGFQAGIEAILQSSWEAYGFYTGRFDLDYPIQTILEFPEHDSFNYGGPATIQTSYIVTEGWALETEFPPVGVVTLDFEYMFNPFMDIIICVFSCDTMHLIPPSVQVPHTIDTLFHINGYDEYTVYPCFDDENGFHFCHGYFLPIDVDFTDLVDFDFIVQVDLPHVETEAYIEEETNCLIAHGSDEYMHTHLDILGFLYVMAGFIPEPEGPAIQEAIAFLNGEFDYSFDTPLGPIGFHIDYSLLSVYFHVANTLVQDIYFCPTIWAKFDFPVELPYIVTDPSNGGAEISTGVSDTIEVAVGHDLTITYPCHGVEPYLDSMYVGVRYNIQPTIRNHTWDSIAFSIAIEALTAEITVILPFKSTYQEIQIPDFELPSLIEETSKSNIITSQALDLSDLYQANPDNPEKDISYEIGPLFEWTINLGYVPVTWFDQTWELMHFEEDLIFPGTWIKPYDKSEINALLFIEGNAYCYGEPFSYIYAEAQNGLPPFAYEWSTGDFTDFTESDTDSVWAAPGYYSVTITDTYGCESYDSLTVFVNPPILALLTPTDLLCHGVHQGSIETSVSGGTPPYFFNWSNGSIQMNPQNLASGWHTVTITDWVGCQYIDSVFLDQPATPLTINAMPTHIPCNGSAYGSINVQLYGATPPYSVEWSSGQTYLNIAYLEAGPYTISVTDANGCLWTETIYIYEPDLLVATMNYDNIPCAGDDNGSITVNVTGGTPEYTYYWFHDESETSNSLTDLHPGMYMVSVVDQNNCSDTATAIITEPDELLLDFMISDVSCRGGNNGHVIVTPYGGVPEYLIHWSTGHYSDSIGSLAAGNYTVTVTDDNDCYNIETISVGQPEYVLTSSFTDIINVSCNGFSDASADVNPHGGTEPYTVVWQEDVEQEGFAGYGMPAGIYFNITVTDTNNCVYYDSIRFTQPSVLVLNGTTNELVCGELAGSGTITPSGGTPPYNYYWSNQEITQTATDLPAGTVYATVTDSHDCVEEIELEVQKTGKILADYQIIEENLCYNDSLAVVYLTLPEGSEPVQYLWENGFEGQTQSDLAEGYYYVTILDKYNCGDTLNVYVSHPDSINPNITKIQPSCSGVYDGSLISEPTGGTPDYTYLWSDGSNENEFTEIREGIYYLTITDQNLCIFEFIYELEEAQYCIFVYNTFTPNGDGVNDTWIIENIEEFRFNQVWVYNRIGNPVYHSEFYQNNWDGTFNGNELPAGTYYYIIDLGTGRESIKGHVTIIR